MRTFIILNSVMVISLVAENRDLKIEEINGPLEEEASNTSSVESVDKGEIALVRDLNNSYLEHPNAMQLHGPLDISSDANQELTKRRGAHWFFFGQGTVPTLGVGLRFIGPYPQHEISVSSLTVMLIKCTYNLIFPIGETQSWYFGGGVSSMASPFPPFSAISASLIIGYWGKALFSDLGIEPIFTPNTNEFFALPTLRLGFHF